MFFESDLLSTRAVYGLLGRMIVLEASEAFETLGRTWGHSGSLLSLGYIFWVGEWLYFRLFGRASVYTVSSDNISP